MIEKYTKIDDKTMEVEQTSVNKTICTKAELLAEKQRIDDMLKVFS